MRLNLPLRILHIVGDSKFGGGSIMVLKLAQRAREAGYDVSVLTTDSVFQQVLKEYNIKIVDLDVIWREIRPVKDLFGLYKLYSYLRKNRYDIIHTHTSKAGFVGRIAARLAGVPIIIHTVHGFAFHEESNFIEVKLFSFLEKIAGYFCDKIVTVSEFHRKWALKLKIANEDKIVSIPNGIAKDRVIPKRKREVIREELKLSEDDFIILTTGRLAPQKGIEYLIRAVPLLISKIESFKLLIVGEGPLRDYLEDLVRELKIVQYVYFLGFRRDVGDLLNIADVVVLPSLWEGLSIALLEAMAASKPIITTSIGSNIEVLEDGVAGILVPSKNVERLAEAILKLYEDKDFRKKIALAGYNRYRDCYTEERMLDKYMELYKEMIDKKLPS